MATVKFPFDHFSVGEVGEFGAQLARAGYEIPLSEDLSPLAMPFKVNGRRIENSMAVQPLEGLDGCENGAPSELTLARYEKLAAQGAGILWVEATAVCREGRDSVRQLWLHQESLPGFRTLVQTIDSAAAKAGHKPPYKIIQLTHSGRCSVDKEGQPAPAAAFANPYLDPVMGTPQIVSDDYLDQLQGQVCETAALAAQAGFDAVELKLCHRYLFEELLCAYTRPGRYGGSQENRFRFALGAVDQIRRKLGSRMDVTVRLNAYDGIPWPYGWGMQPHPDGAPKNVMPMNHQIPAYGGSSWRGNTDYRQIDGREASNWSGNPSPLQVSDAEKSSWQGNPQFSGDTEGQHKNWRGNASFEPGALTEKSNWSGNPSPLQISNEERSSWQGNAAFVPGCDTERTSWQGNPGFVPEACRSCAAAPAGCANCEVLQTCGIPPMPGPMQINLTEVKELMVQLYRRGVRIVNLTTTSPRFAPTGNGYMDNFRDDAEVDPFAGTAALLRATKEIRSQCPADLNIVGTGLSWFGPFSANAGAGGISKGWFDIAGFGRSVMTDNEFIPSILRGKQPDRARACIGCDGCFKMFFAGLPTGCPMHHAAYGDVFRQMP